MPALEIGCGLNRDPQCDTFMDANCALPNLDWCGDLAGPLPWPDNTFDLIVAKDCLEHAPYRRTLAALTEWARVLRPGGRLFVQVPDCGRIMREWARDEGRWTERLPADLQHLPPFIGVVWRIMGGQDDGTYGPDGDRWNLHLAMFDEDSLHWYVVRAGLVPEHCKSNPHPNLQMWAYKP